MVELQRFCFYMHLLVQENYTNICPHYSQSDIELHALLFPEMLEPSNTGAITGCWWPWIPPGTLTSCQSSGKQPGFVELVTRTLGVLGVFWGLSFPSQVWVMDLQLSGPDMSLRQGNSNTAGECGFLCVGARNVNFQEIMMVGGKYQAYWLLTEATSVPKLGKK